MAQNGLLWQGYFRVEQGTWHRKSAMVYLIPSHAFGTGVEDPSSPAESTPKGCTASGKNQGNVPIVGVSSLHDTHVLPVGVPVGFAAHCGVSLFRFLSRKCSVKEVNSHKQLHMDCGVRAVQPVGVIAAMGDLVFNPGTGDFGMLPDMFGNRGSDHLTRVRST